MASFASSATTCGARKHAWTKMFHKMIESMIIWEQFQCLKCPLNFVDGKQKMGNIARFRKYVGMIVPA